MTDISNLFNNKKYAIIKNNKIIDCVLIHPDDVETILPNAIELHQADETIEITGQLSWLGVGCIKDDGVWRMSKPYDSWVWDGENWTAPVPKPEGNHIWNEALLLWAPIFE